MKLCRPILALLFFLFSFSVVSAQSYSITGYVTDTLNDNRLRFASVTLINANDSVLETFTRTAEDGSFQLRPRREGKYIIMVTFPSFADYVDIVTLTKAKPTLSMGVIPMVSKTHLLSEFVLKQQIGAIKIKGDTTEYVADSFVVRENATVEELLKKLPGIQVNKNGEVVAQGERVQKILVDGEEFFTDDPAVVTKSLQAKAVDKVQVFDKKSDQSQFTGIDDGTREKTINLQLKDHMRKGYFGKLNTGGGTDGFFENQGMINAFKGKRKLSAFGIAANTGKLGLGWQDRDRFGGNSNSITEVSDDGGMMITVTQGSDDNFESWNGQFNGQGLPTAWTGGLHYSNKWNEDRQHLSSNYRYAKQNIDAVGNTLTQINTNSTSDLSQYYNDERKNSFSTGERHRADALYEWKIDSTSTLKITANASASRTQTTTDFHTEIYDTVRTRSIMDRLTTSDASGRTLNASLAYRKKFARKGRTISLTLDEWYKENTSDGVLRYSGQIFLRNPSGNPDTVVNELTQLKRNDAKNLQVTGNISYTEPLSDVAFLEVNYGLIVNNSYAKRLSYNDSIGESNPQNLDPLFSSDYDFNVLTHRGGSNLRFVYKKINFSFGGAISATNFKQIDRFSANNATLTRQYTNLFPRASFVYRPSQQKTFSFNYNGSTQQPTLEQIQPLRQNTDPNNIAIGNEQLTQKFNHSFNLRYNDYKVISGTFTYLGAGFNVVDDDISRSETITDGGARIYQYKNVDGNYNGFAYGGYGWTLRRLDMRVGFNGSVNVGRTITFVNGERNENHNNTYSLGVTANYDKEKKFNISYNPRVSYANNAASVNRTRTNFWTLTNELEASFQLPWKFEVGTEVEWNLRQRVAQFERNNSIFLWTAYLSKKLLKGDQLEIRASAYDILNQNVGFQRFGFAGNITEQAYNTIRRYGMLSIIWNFSKTPGGAPQEASGQHFRFKL